MSRPLLAASLFFAAVSPLSAANRPAPQGDVAQLPAVVVFGQRPSAVITPGLLKRLGGEKGAKDWVVIMVSRLQLNFALRAPMSRFQTPAEQETLSTLLVNTMLGLPLGVDRSVIDKVDQLDLTAEQFNSITETVLDTCEETRLSYRDCNRILVSIRPVGLYARGF